MEGLRGTAGGLPEGGAGERGERRARVRDCGLRERERLRLRESVRRRAADMGRERGKIRRL